MSWATDVEKRTVAAFAPLAKPETGKAMEAYMKNLFPFLGIPYPVRRAALKTAWADLPVPSEREYHHAVCDMFARYVRPTRSAVSAAFLLEYGGEFVTTKSWWDTVDGLRSDLIGP
jgi:3-methyladenine DNA glycosylase AlkD